MMVPKQENFCFNQLEENNSEDTNLLEGTDCILHWRLQLQPFELSPPHQNDDLW
jgi:hypothetical protein